MSNRLDNIFSHEIGTSFDHVIAGDKPDKFQT